MLVYTKIVEGVKKLFGTEGNIPADTDNELTYLDENGSAITPVANDTYRDASSNGILRIKRESDGKFVNVFIGDTQIIGDPVTPPTRVLTGIEITNPTKLAYNAGEALDLTGMVVKAVYDDATTDDVTSQAVCVPANGAILTDETSVEVSYTEDEVTKTGSISITVTPANAE